MDSSNLEVHSYRPLLPELAILSFECGACQQQPQQFQRGSSGGLNSGTRISGDMGGLSWTTQSRRHMATRIVLLQLFLMVGGSLSRV